MNRDKILIILPRLPGSLLHSIFAINDDFQPLIRFRLYKLCLLLLLLMLVAACNPMKKVQHRGGYLLVRNTVKTDNPSLPSDEVAGFVQQKAIKSQLTVFRPGVWIYENTSRGKETAFKKWFREKFGAQPVILDSNLVARSEYNIRAYLRNKGFYHSKITHEFKYKNSTVSVTYRILAGKPYTISRLSYSIPDSLFGSFFFPDTVTSLLHTGAIFDTYKLDDERDRITQDLRSKGYFNFSKANITYRVDTAAGDLRANLTLVIKKIQENAAEFRDTVPATAIHRYFIRNIYVMPDVDQSLLTGGKYDTLAFKFRYLRNDTVDQTLYYIHGQKIRLKPIAFSEAITLHTGQAYSQESIKNTYKKLIGLPIVRSVNIGLSASKDPLAPKEKQWLDCSIKLTRNPANTYNLGTEGTNSSGSLGLGFNFLFQNRNIFRRAEVFHLKINTSAELQVNVSQPATNSKLGLFNALESGFEAGIDFPRLLLPVPLYSIEHNFMARTSLTAGYGFETRADYSRKLTTFSGSYQWNTSQKIKHIFTPLELSYVSINKDSAFQAYLNKLTDPQFLGQYNNHLLTMIRYSMVWTNQMISKERKLFYIRLNAETSGNMFYWVDQITGKTPESGGYYTRFGVRYAQYFRYDVDLRKFWKISANRTIAFRITGGEGVPYGNSVSIPFEKSFWLGGANDMRGWRLRSLGPGRFINDSVSYDRTGDISLQSTLEYRFGVYSFLNGSFFMDAGNIWLRNQNPDFPGGEFKLATFADQLAMDAGLGFRFDFSFFLFRVDWALRLKNPGLTKQWFQPQDFAFRKAVWNFGIGYPF